MNEAGEPQGAAVGPADPAEVIDDPWGAPAARAAAADTCRAVARAGRNEATAELGRRLAELPAGAPASQVLGSALRLAEQRFRRPVVGDYVLRRLFAGSLFAARKALDLLAADRSPQLLAEGFVRASGPMGGLALTPRDVFVQRLRPLRAGDRRPVVLVPGLDETGRHLADLTWALSADGHEIFTMDAPWAGQTRSVTGTPPDGGLDAGFGTARDLAAVIVHAARQCGGQAPVLVGCGSGAAAVFLLLIAQAAGLAAAELPPALDAGLVSPYLAPGPSTWSRLAAWLAPLPWGREQPLARWSAATAGLAPRPVRAEAAARDPVRTRLGSLALVQDGLRAAWTLLGRGHRPHGHLAVVHDADDAWGDPRVSYRLRAATALGDRALVRIVGHADGEAARARLAAARWCLARLQRAARGGRAAA